jgi:DNA-directed RNA polymerase specialized sigma24 family protein
MVTSQTSGQRDFDTLFRTHYGRIARVIGRVVRDQARAEELAVDVFVKWRRNAGANSEMAEGWLRTAAREAIDEWRRQARRAKFESLFSVFETRLVRPRKHMRRIPHRGTFGKCWGQLTLGIPRR